MKNRNENKKTLRPRNIFYYLHTCSDEEEVRQKQPNYKNITLLSVLETKFFKKKLLACILYNLFYILYYILSIHIFKKTKN